MNQDQLYGTLREVVGNNGVVEGSDVGEKYYVDARGRGDIKPPFVLRPDSTEQLSRIMKICHDANQPIIAQGGMTGLVAGCRPQQYEIPVSFERMSAIEEHDQQTGTMTVQSGVPLQVVQEAADANDFLFPLDLGARGSCTVGGNLSTNAGGNRVIRYGMTRDLVLGLEAVLADGTVVSSMNRFVKNNTGYDLKQLFIGSEGTLGLITRAVLRLSPKPRSQSVAVCGADSFDAVVKFMRHAQSRLGGDLSAFEVLWQTTYALIVETVHAVKAPLSGDFRYYILLESMGGDMQSDQDRFEAVLAEALESGLIADAAISRSAADVDALWLVRDGMAEAMGNKRPAARFDVSLAITDMEYFVDEVGRRLTAKWPDAEYYVGGHLGDGNLHMAAKASRSDDQPIDEISRLVYELIGELNGSISAEHGIGLNKRPYLSASRSPAEVALMKTLKRALDPKGILSPGRIFEL